MRIWRSWAVFVVTGLGVVFVLDLAFNARKPPAELVIRTIGYAIGAAFGDLAIVLSRSRAERKAMAELRWLERCASCGYSLRGLPKEADGCVVCPERRATWNLDNPGH